MSQQALSPLMQVMHTPSLVISHWHIPMVRLQQQTMVPFMKQQQLHLPLAIMVQMFCSMLQAIGSWQEQVIFMPPVHFSIFMVQRGIIMPLMAGFIAGIAAPMLDIIPEVMGFIVAVVTLDLLDLSPMPHCHLGCAAISGICIRCQVDRLL
jgi:hypothetical protein